MKKDNFLIVGGATKCGTTSLFKYLSIHPKICVTNQKELRFFNCNESYVESGFKDPDDIESYKALFKCNRNEMYCLDSTPDYLYTPQVCERIHRHLKSVKLIFTLREPVERLISWFRYAKQKHLIKGDITLDQYIETILAAEKEKDVPPYLKALEQGRYSQFLQPFFERFSKKNVLVVFSKELSETPLQVMSDICEFTGLDDSVFADYTFPHFNKTLNTQQSGFNKFYQSARFKIRKHTRNIPVVYPLLRSASQKVYQGYVAKNTEPERPLGMSEKIFLFLKQYYNQEEKEHLSSMIDREIPW